jgi:hypothetical protein
MAKGIYISATERNMGKTSISIGLIKYMIERGMKVGFMKPIAQRYVEVDGGRFSADAVLVKRIFALPHRLEDMSPVVVEKGLTEEYIMKKRRSFKRRIVSSYRRIAQDSEFVVVEGTGHAGVGSCLDMSNPDVAKAISAPVLMVAEGGIGNTIDRTMLNKSLFELKEVRVLGIVINKVREEKYERIQNLLKVAFKAKGMDVFGFVPYIRHLATPTIAQIAKQTNATVISSNEGLEEEIDDISVATMEPHAVLDLILNSEKNLFLITSSDRVDVLLAIVASFFEGAKNLKGVLLSGKNPPPANILHALKKTNIPVLIAGIGVYTLASMLLNLSVKTTPDDKRRIESLCKLTKKHLNTELIMKTMEKEKEAPIGFMGWWRKIFKRMLRFFKELSRVSHPQRNQSAKINRK